MNFDSFAFFHKLKALPFIEEIWLYGSRARGDSSDRSNLDLAIVCPRARDTDWQEIENICEETDTLLKIDVV
jgi:uncharacterized protein